MKIILSLLIALLFSSLTIAQTTAIPDPNFEQRLINLGYDNAPIDGSVLTANISSVTSLSVGTNVSDLTGIEGFSALTSLVAQNLPNLSNINLTQNLALIYLNIGSNQLTSLDLTQNLALTHLNCTTNLITSLDLSQNSALTSLDCHGNNLTCLNIKNGNNLNINPNTFRSYNNPSLYCIEVDNVAWATVNLINIDAASSFSTYCNNSCSIITGIDMRTECDSLVWIDGNIYTSNNNVASHNLAGAAANGNDSLVILDLTIINSTTGTDTRTECDSLFWIDGNTYYSSNNTSNFNIVGGATNSCDSLVTLDLIINTVNSLVTQTGTLLTAVETGATYQWLDCSGMSLIGGDTNQSYTATSNGDYAVIITNNGCTDTSACYTITGVGINEHNSSQLNIYPNPATHQLRIATGLTISKVTIVDLTGKTMITNNQPTKHFDVADLPSGIYFIKVATDRTIITKKFVKQ